MTEFSPETYFTDPIYTKISRILIGSTQMVRNAQTASVEDQLKKEQELLTFSGEEFRKQFMSGIANNDFILAGQRSGLIETIEEVKDEELGSRKTWLQACLAITYNEVTQSPYLPQTTRDNWKNLTDKLIQENKDKLEEGYVNSPLSTFEPKDFPDIPFQSLAESLDRNGRFETLKQASWLLTS